MEVSTLRDRRLVALFATIVIGGAGTAAAVMSVEGDRVYRGPAATEAALAPQFSEPPQSPVVAEPGPVIVVAAPDTRPSDTTEAIASPASSPPFPAPDPCAVGDGKHGSKAPKDCPKPPKPEPGPKVELADAGPAPRAPKGVVIASDQEPRPEPKPRHDEADDEPKPRPEPKPGPKGKGGH